MAEYGPENLLQLPGLNIGSPVERILVRHIPLVFPLPCPLHGEVSDCMRRAVRTARLQHPTRFEDAVLRLNALWDGLAEELQGWLDIQPRGMTLRAAAHLQQLPGFAESEPARRLVQRYTPPEPVRPWQGIEEDFDGWVTDYARYVRQCFVRRELPESDDPGTSFGRWLKEHCGVSYTHPERGYSRLARQVRESLQRGRSVVVVMIDALALHLAKEAIGYLKDYLKEDPTWSSYLLTAVPTITEVCKEAVLTGWRPDQCSGGLVPLLCQGLRPERRSGASRGKLAGRRAFAGTMPGPDLWFIGTINSTTRYIVHWQLSLYCSMNRRACFGGWPNWWPVG